MTETLATLLATLLVAKRNCEKTGNAEWANRHDAALVDLVENFMPQGSGFATGLLREKSGENRLVFQMSYHHMDSCGFYDGYTSHIVTLRASFIGTDIRVSGRDRNDIKDYIAEMFATALAQRIVWSAAGFRRAESIPAVA